MRVLIAEDDLTSSRILQAVLEQWGYEVEATHDGAEACARMGEPDAPRLAIMDWIMPGMDGVEICREVRRCRIEDPPYIILLTSRGQKGDVVIGLEAGADDYITKPYDRHELRARLRVGERVVTLQHALAGRVRDLGRSESALAEARSQEGRVAGRIQESLLQGRPPVDWPQVSVATLAIPSQAVDGDFYDFFAQGEHCLDIVLGDVMGKGVPAALIGAAAKSEILRAMTHLLLNAHNRGLPRPDKIVGRVHEILTPRLIDLETAVTLCYARLDLPGARVAFVDCGHTKTVHYRHSLGRCELLEGPNVPFGFQEAATYRQESAELGEGDVLLFYSDGLTEARNAEGEFFGVERLARLVKQERSLAPAELLEAVRSAAVNFSGGAVFADDLTCVAARIERMGPGWPLFCDALQTTSEVESLGRIQAFIRAFCSRVGPAGVSEDLTAQVQLAVHEAACNVIEHAYKEQSGRPIWLRAEAFRDRVRFELRDEGAGFDPESVKPPPFDGSEEGGFGLYIIRASFDEIEYSRDPEGRNLLVLGKRI